MMIWSRKSFTLIELVAAITLVVVIILAISVLFNFLLSVYHRGVEDSQVQLEIQEAMDLLSKYINNSEYVQFNSPITGPACRGRQASNSVTLMLMLSGSKKEITCEYTLDSLTPPRARLQIYFGTPANRGQEIASFARVFAAFDPGLHDPPSPQDYRGFLSLEPVLDAANHRYKGAEIILSGYSPPSYGFLRQGKFLLRTKAYSRLPQLRGGIVLVIAEDENDNQVLQRYDGPRAIRDAANMVTGAGGTGTIFYRCRQCSSRTCNSELNLPMSQEEFGKLKPRILISEGEYNGPIIIQGRNVPLIGGFSRDTLNAYRGGQCQEFRGSIPPTPTPQPEKTIINSRGASGPVLYVRFDDGYRGYDNGKFSVTGITFRNGGDANPALPAYSGIYIFNTASAMQEVNILNNIIEDNRGSGNFGCGINYLSEPHGNTNITISNNIVRNNSSSSNADPRFASVGGIGVDKGKNIEILGNQVLNNQGGRYVGIAAFNGGQNNNVCIQDNEVRENIAGAIGAGINYCAERKWADICIKGNKVLNNQAGGGTAGIGIDNVDQFKILDNEVSGNTGGGTPEIFIGEQGCGEDQICEGFQCPCP